MRLKSSECSKSTRTTTKTTTCHLKITRNWKNGKINGKLKKLEKEKCCYIFSAEDKIATEYFCSSIMEFHNATSDTYLIFSAQHAKLLLF